MSEITITASNFQEEVLQSDRPVLLDFWAAWCGPCRMLAPTLSRLAEEYPEIKVGKVNIDEERDLAADFGIEAIPTLYFIKNGEPVEKTLGVQPYEALEQMIR